MEGEDYKHSSMEDEKKEMFDSFYYWAVQNYGDSGKTKTVTRKKYQRITDILTGDEPPTAGNSKFRFWVKGKGFRVGPEDGVNEDKTCLYVPTKPITDTNSNDTNTEYKRVAIVEDFFDIIYSVHVEMDGRGGKHAGQKRTYRAIAEKYAFLPREAVTRFLMSCSDCQKRMHLSSSERSNTESPSALPSQYNPVYRHEPDLPGLPIVDFTLPITQTYLNHLKSRNLACDDMSDEAKEASTGRSSAVTSGSACISVASEIIIDSSSTVSSNLNLVPVSTEIITDSSSTVTSSPACVPVAIEIISIPTGSSGHASTERLSGNSVPVFTHEENSSKQLTKAGNSESLKQELLTVEKERLKTEKRRLQIEEERLALERSKFEELKQITGYLRGLSEYHGKSNCNETD